LPLRHPAPRAHERGGGLIAPPFPHRSAAYLDFFDAFAAALEGHPDVQYVDHRIDESVREFYRNTFLDFALLYLDEDALEEVKTRLSDDAIRRQVALNREMLRTAAVPGARRLVLRDPLGMREVFARPMASARGRMRISLADGYYFSEDHTMLFMLVKPSVLAQDMRFNVRFLQEVQAIEAEVRAEFPEESQRLRVAYTGRYAIGNDYVTAIKRDAVWTFALSFASVMVLFLVAFRRAGMLVVVGVPLLMGVIWTLGVTYFTLGRLNVVTSTVGAILLGLGIDYGIHIYNQYAAERAAGRATDEAIVAALTGIGAGLFSAAFSTALAFFALVPTKFRGLSEMGLATGIGILLCLLSMYFVMPALLTLRARCVRGPAGRYAMHSFGLARLEEKLMRHPRALMFLSVLVSGALAVAALGVKFDDDFRNIRPREGAAIEAQKRLVEKVGSPLLHTMMLVRGDSQEEALHRAATLDTLLARLTRQGYLLSHQSILSFLPPRAQQERALQRLARVHSEAPRALSYARVRRTFEEALKREGFESVAPFEDALAGIERALSVSRSMELHDLERAGLSRLLERFRHKREHGEPYELVFYVYLSEELPSEEVTRVLLETAAGLRGTEVVSPKALAYELKRIIREDFGRASVYAFLAVLGVLWFHFRRPARMAIVAAPLVLGAVWMVGLMSLLKIPFNMVNVVVLPVILGIGIDDGIHMLHHYLTDAGRDLTKTFRLVGRAVMMTSLTTMAGFGSLVFSSYGGLHTVGQVAFLGISTCLVATLGLMPLLIRRFAHRI
jgi:predicted RND superfamily exporter protein